MKKNNDVKICKTCSKVLHDGYKYKRCDSCRTKQIEKIQSKGAITLGILGVVGTAIAVGAETLASLGKKK